MKLAPEVRGSLDRISPSTTCQSWGANMGQEAPGYLAEQGLCSKTAGSKS